MSDTVNGMTDPIQVMGFKNLRTTDEDGSVTSWHQVPFDQFVHSLDESASCLCGPDVDYDFSQERPIPFVTHFALDSSYYRGRDWGPDGPEPDHEPVY